MNKCSCKVASHCDEQRLNFVNWSQCIDTTGQSSHFHSPWLKEVITVRLSDKKEITSIGKICFIFPLLKLCLTIFFDIFRATDFFIISFLKTMQQHFFMVVKKSNLMFLSQRFYGAYPAGNVMFRINNDKTSNLSNDLLVSHAFTSCVLICLVSHVFICRRQVSIWSQWGLLWNVLYNYSGSTGNRELSYEGCRSATWNTLPKKGL